MTTELQSAFPTRPLRVLRHGAAASWINYLAGLAFLAGAIGVLYWQGPTLLTDNQIRNNLVVVPDGTVRNGKCRTRKFVFTECEADIAWTVDGKRYTAHPDIFFLDVNSGGYRTGVVRASTNPALGTMSIAIDYFWDRVATVLGFAGLLAGIGVLGFVTGRRNDRIRRTASGDAVPLTLVPAQITKASKVWGGASYEFKAEVGGKARNFTSRFGKDEAPFETLEGHFLAAIPQGAPTAILLDGELRRIDLTDEERERILRAAYTGAQRAA